MPPVNPTYAVFAPTVVGMLMAVDVVKVAAAVTDPGALAPSGAMV